MISLNQREWKAFSFPDIFVIKGGFYNKKPPNNPKGTVPFIGATSVNNGITSFTSIKEIQEASKSGHGSNEEFSKKLFAGNCIVVTNNGSVGYAYYQEHDFTCTHDVNPLYLRHRVLTRLIAMFLIAAIEKQRICFEYARKWRPARMKNSQILLPVSADGRPDWDFMSTYMRQQEQLMLEQTMPYFKQRLLNNLLALGVSSETRLGGVKLDDLFANMISLNQREWKAFFIEDHLLINSGKRLTKADMHSGRIPFVGATGLNNGVTSFVSNENESTQANVLGVNYNGSVVETFYHPYRATFSDDVKRVTIKESGANNQYSLLFVKQCLLQQKSKYAYGYKFNAERMRRQKIMLPVTAEGTPDWGFMSAYMCAWEALRLVKQLARFEIEV